MLGLWRLGGKSRRDVRAVRNAGLAIRSSLTGLVFLKARDPALKCWAVFAPPSGLEISSGFFAPFIFREPVIRPAALIRDHARSTPPDYFFIPTLLARLAILRLVVTFVTVPVARYFDRTVSRMASRES